MKIRQYLSFTILLTIFCVVQAQADEMEHKGSGMDMDMHMEEEMEAPVHDPADPIFANEEEWTQSTANPEVQEIHKVHKNLHKEAASQYYDPKHTQLEKEVGMYTDTNDLHKKAAPSFYKTKKKKWSLFRKEKDKFDLEEPFSHEEGYGMFSRENAAINAHEINNSSANDIHRESAPFFYGKSQTTREARKMTRNERRRKKWENVYEQPAYHYDEQEYNTYGDTYEPGIISEEHRDSAKGFYRKRQTHYEKSMEQLFMSEEEETKKKFHDSVE